jgi:threonine synthase
MYLSLGNSKDIVSFKKALFTGLAPDKSLYFPVKIDKLSKDFWKNLKKMNTFSLAYEVIKNFTKNEIPKERLFKIIKNTIDFDFPTVLIEKNLYSLELFHGPTMAFKDVGAKFMSGCMNYFIETENLKRKITVLVATSGDTGGAVANGFLGVDGVDVVILYPKGRVSEIQESQLTTLGKNVSALEIDGYFDECQEMVKKSFLDSDLNKKLLLTSANSINIARWIPQVLYYFIAYKNLYTENLKVVFSVPSGNFGNLCAGMLAKKMGLPINHFVASTNENDTVPKFMKTGKYKKQKTISTITNAMDVGDPSNFVRILKIYNNNFQNLKKELTAYSFSDKETILGMQKLYQKSKYLLDPHGSIAYLGLKKYLATKPEETGVFLETAHPIKFLDTVENALNKKIEIPKHILELKKKKKTKIGIKDYEELKSFLLSK